MKRDKAATIAPTTTFPASFRFTWREIIAILAAHTRAAQALDRLEHQLGELYGHLQDARTERDVAVEELRMAKNRAKNADAYFNNARVHLGTGNFNEALLALDAGRERLVEPPPEEE